MTRVGCRPRNRHLQPTSRRASLCVEPFPLHRFAATPHSRRAQPGGHRIGALPAVDPRRTGAPRSRPGHGPRGGGQMLGEDRHPHHWPQASAPAAVTAGSSCAPAAGEGQGGEAGVRQTGWISRTKAPDANPRTQLTGALFVVGPMALYGLFLLRHARVRAGWQDDFGNNSSAHRMSPSKPYRCWQP